MARQSGLRSSMPCVWSAWGWLKRTPSSRLTSASISCSRKSGEVSMSTVVAPSDPEALDQHRAAAAAVLRVGRIAGAPPLPDPRHAAGRAAAEDGQTQRQCDDPTACGGLPRPAEACEKQLQGVGARRLGQRFGRRFRAPRRPRPPWRRQRPARCGGRDGASARDRARRSRPECGRAGRRARWRASPPTS